MLPLFAYLALWQLPANIGGKAIQATLKQTGPDELTTATQSSILDALSDQGWRLCEGARIRGVNHFFAQPSSLDSCIIACITNAPVQQACHEVLQLESLQRGSQCTVFEASKDSRRRKYAKDQSDEGVKQSASMGMVMAKGDIADKCLMEAAQVIIF